MRYAFWRTMVGLALALLGTGMVWPAARWGWLGLAPCLLLGLYDSLQRRHAILRNFPVLGHIRYLLEGLRPEIRQYFIESDTDGVPFDREKRSIVYQRAKGQLDTLPFGTQVNVYAVGYEWIEHSLMPQPVASPPRITIGGETCQQPYAASLLNISAMSFGALSHRAILALNQAALAGGFYHNTGEGGLSPYHLEPGGDLVWQLGTGYFGCRTPEGGFDAALFAQRAAAPQVKMIELKLSQGAKPGHGGILPASKLTPEIVAIRNVQPGRDVVSPPAHTAFRTPVGLLEFLAELRQLSGGKPVGFKLCIGRPHEFLAIVRAMLETGLTPDFITVDGAEGGTGAAPMEFSDSVGTPLREGLSLVHNALLGAGLRHRVRLIAAGKITTGFHLASLLALGADVCNCARGMMFALGCIQALRCNNNTCPTGITTQDPELMAGLVIGDKAPRVAHFHRETVHSLLEVTAAAGLASPQDLRPEHIQRRTSTTEVQSFAQIYPRLETGALLTEALPPAWAAVWGRARASTFISA